MATHWDALREQVKKIDMKFDDVHLDTILMLLINEIEKLSNEIHQGYTKPK